MYVRVKNEKCVWCLADLTRGIAYVYMGKKFCKKADAYKYSRVTGGHCRGEQAAHAIRLATSLLLGQDDPERDPDGAAPMAAVA